MTQQEYEQKKRECWEEFRTHVICGTDNPKGFFERAFDRAYALGKQTETITQEEIEDAAKDYANNVGDSDWERLRVQDAFKAGANYLMEQPLTSRMTAEEKERVRTYHKLAREGYWECNCANNAVVKVLESIFGKDFFKEGE